jgi:hypothetical protein
VAGRGHAPAACSPMRRRHDQIARDLRACRLVGPRPRVFRPARPRRRGSRPRHDAIQSRWRERTRAKTQHLQTCLDTLAEGWHGITSLWLRKAGNAARSCAHGIAINGRSGRAILYQGLSPNGRK